MPIVRIEHAVPNFEKWKQAFESDPADRKGSGVRIDLEFDTLVEAQTFLTKMQRLWDGPGKAVMQSPRARVAEIVEARQL